MERPDGAAHGVLDGPRSARYDRRVKFLVVEGTEAAREAIARALLPRGIQGVPAADRSAAWEALKADTSIEGAIVDVDGPAVEGVRFIEEIKADEVSRSLTIIVHTAQTNRTFVLKLIETGAAGFLLGAFTPAGGPARLDRALATLSGHDRQRRHVRVRPDPDEMIRVSFRVPGGKALVTGRVVDISLGGMAVELLNPPSGGPPGPGALLPSMSIALPGCELEPGGTVVTAQGRTVALRFDSMTASDRTAIERYIFRRISA